MSICPRPSSCCENFSACTENSCEGQPPQFLASIDDFDTEYVVGEGVYFNLCLLTKCCEDEDLVYDQTTPEDFFTLPVLAETIPSGAILALDANNQPILGTVNLNKEGCIRFLVTEDFLSSLGLLAIGTDVELASGAVLRFAATLCSLQSIADVSLSFPILQA